MTKQFLFKGGFFLILFSLSFLAQGQEIKRHMEVNVIPPSPTASSFQKFIDMPVNLYTGTPEISIPLFQLSMQQLSLPISLSYHAGGMKVEERASWVGAGWSLNAGGAISRSIKGLPDEFKDPYHKGYFHTGYLFSGGVAIDYTKVMDCDHEGGNPVVTSEDPRTRPDSISMGRIDLEPDLFYYSSPGASGKFVFSHQRNYLKLVADDAVLTEDPFSNWAFPAGAIDYTWQIKGGDGVVYTFSQAESTQVSSSCGGSMISPYDPQVAYPNTWYLEEMAINGEWIKFYYTDETLIYSDRYTESAQFKVPGTGTGPQIIVSNCVNTITTHAKRLDRIESSNGYIIYFDPFGSVRTDVPGSKRLDKIRVLKDNVPVISFKLEYSSFNNDKLKLTDVKQFLDAEQNNINTYHFDYQAGTLPAIDSKSQDYWGYHNGSDNSFSMIPPLKIGYFYVNQLSTANREPSLGSAMTGNLVKITFPTGGNRQFDYELHDYYDTSYPTTYIYSAIAVNGTQQNPVTDIESFSVPIQCYATVQTDGNPEEIGTTHLLEKWNGSGYVSYTPSVSVGNRVLLEAGGYRITVQNSNQGNTYYSLEVEQPESKNVLVGGLRVKKITNYDPIAGKSYIKIFEYTDSLGHSSGKLFTPQILGGNLVTHIPGHMSGDFCAEDAPDSYISAAAYTQVPLSVYNSSHIGYSEVKEYLLSEGDLLHPELKKAGMTRYKFINEAPTLSAQFPFPPLPDLSYVNGKTLSVLHYVSVNDVLKKVQETRYQYKSRAHTEVVYGAVLKSVVTRFCFACNSTDYAMANYNYSTSSIYTDWESEYHFDDNEILSMRIDKKMYYDSVAPYIHYQSVGGKTIGSDGKVIVTQIDRDANSPDLISELRKYANGVLTGGEKYTYTGKLVTDFYYYDFNQNAYLKRNKFVYDNARLLSVTDFPDESTPIVKSYYYESSSDDLPVAEAINASLADIFFTGFESTGISESTGNPARSGKKYWNAGTYNFSVNSGFTTLRSDLRMSYWYWSSGQWNWEEIPFNNAINKGTRLDDVRVYPPGSQMRSFTYKKGVGLESITDAGNNTVSYTYDNFNRPFQIKDHNGNIVKEFKYHYFNEQP